LIFADDDQCSLWSALRQGALYCGILYSSLERIDGQSFTNHRKRCSEAHSLDSQVGTILGQISIGLLCDYKGRKWGIVLSTVCIVVGVILATAAHGSGNDLRRNFTGFIWFLTVARGLTGIGVGGK